MIKQGKYSEREYFRIRPDQAIWLSQQPNSKNETIRRLIDDEIKRQKENLK